MWEEIMSSEKYGLKKDTGINQKILTELGKTISTLPEDFEFNPQIKKIYHQRLDSFNSGTGIDWGTAEALAFASLMTEGYHVRISG